jgi:hypothetical protein
MESQLESSKQPLREILRPFHDDLLVCLDARAKARRKKLATPAAISARSLGPQERVDWQTFSAENMGNNSCKPVLGEDDTTYLQVVTKNGPIRFAMFFGSPKSTNSYSISKTGAETRGRPGLQLVLTDDIQTSPVFNPLPYVFAVNGGTEDSSWFELHFVLGEAPVDGDRLSDTIKVSDRYVVRAGDPVEIADTYNVQFEPTEVN